MSLSTFFKSRTGKTILGIVVAFNTLSFVSGAEQWAEISKYSRESGAKINDKKAAVILAALSPTLSAFAVITKEGRIDRVFDPKGTPNDWMVNSVVTATDSVIDNYDKAGLAGLGVMMADNVISFPGAMLGAAAGYGEDRLTHRTPATLAPANP